MKKIGFCIDSLEMGGAEKLLVDIIKGLHESDKYEIYLLTKKKSNSYFYNEIKNLVNYYYLSSGIKIKLLDSIEKKIRFKKFANEVDILIDFLDGDFYKYIKKIKNKRKIVFLHGAYEVLIKNKKIKNKIDIYDDIIITTEKMTEVVKKEYFNKKIHTIYNCINYDYIDEKLKEEVTLNEKKLLSEEFFLTVCRLDEESKDVETLLRTFKNYKGKEKLYIVGDGKDRKKLENICDSLNIKEKVLFLGSKTNPYIYMKNSKLFIFSSKGEGFGLVVAEGLYCNGKVVASNCNYGPEEILLNGSIGELFQVGNKEELLEKIDICLNKEYKKEDIEKSLGRFSKKEYMKKFEGIL